MRSELYEIILYYDFEELDIGIVKIVLLED